MELKPHNQKALNKILDAYNNKKHLLLYVSGVGTGKSYVTMGLLDSMPNARILYIIPKYAVANYLNNEAGFSKYKNRLKFITYNYFSDIEKGKEKLKQYDIVIADEAHHIGSELYGKVLQNVMQSYEGLFLGLTATPERHDKTHVGSMFEQTIKGISNFEAIQQGLMPKFEYLICTPEIDKKTAIAEKLKVKINYDSSTDLLIDIISDNPRDKWICFFSSVKQLNKMEPVIKKVFPNYTIVKIYAALGNSENALDVVRKNQKVIVLSCDMLLEGIHIDSVDGIILFRNVTSMTVFQQMLGRTCSIGKQETPFIVDCTETALRLLAKLLRESEKRVVISGKDKKTYGWSHIMEVSLCNKKYYDITKILKLIMEQSDPEHVNDERWNACFKKAKSFYETNNNLNVPYHYCDGDTKLGVWIATQRITKRENNLSKERIDMLNAIGMSWHVFDEKWMENYQVAEDYFQEFGSLNPKKKAVYKGVSLAAWLTRQRMKKKSGVLSNEKIELLDKIGIEWAPEAAGTPWKDAYEIAKAYYEETGNLSVEREQKYKSFNLGRWIRQQRTYLKNDDATLSEERIQLLNQIGMEWKDSHEKSWDEHINMVKEQNGIVKTSEMKLYRWIIKQKRNYKNGKLSEEKIQQLHELNII